MLLLMTLIVIQEHRRLRKQEDLQFFHAKFPMNQYDVICAVSTQKSKGSSLINLLDLSCLKDLGSSSLFLLLFWDFFGLGQLLLLFVRVVNGFSL